MCTGFFEEKEAVTFKCFLYFCYVYKTTATTQKIEIDNL